MQTLTRIDGTTTMSSALISALNKGLRMTVFIILPSIAWEESGPFNSVKKGFKVLRAAATDFTTSFVVTGLFSKAIILPVSILIIYEIESNVTYPESVWYALLMYIAFAWSISYLAEQLSVARLYMWYMKWEAESKDAISRGRKPKSLSKTQKPSYFDGYMELRKSKDV